MEADADAELRFYEARAAALCASPERAAVGAQPPMDPPPPPPPEQLEIVGDTLKVHFFGVAENNWNLGVHGIGIKRGMTGKGEFSFFDIISLNIDSKFSFSTAGSFADFILETYLDLSGEQMVGNQLKVTKLEGVLPGRAPPTEMVGFSQPILVSYAAGGAAKVELTLYVRTPVLYGARARATRERWALFQERAAQVVPTMNQQDCVGQLRRPRPRHHR